MEEPLTLAERFPHPGERELVSLLMGSLPRRAQWEPAIEDEYRLLFADYSVPEIDRARQEVLRRRGPPSDRQPWPGAIREILDAAAQALADSIGARGSHIAAAWEWEQWRDWTATEEQAARWRSALARVERANAPAFATWLGPGLTRLVAVAPVDTWVVACPTAAAAENCGDRFVTVVERALAEELDMQAVTVRFVAEELDVYGRPRVEVRG